MISRACLLPRLAKLLPIGLFILLVLAGLEKEYGVVQSFVQFICRACIGLDS